MLGQRVADVAEALHGDAQALEVGAAQTRLGSGADAGEHAEGGVRRRVAALGGTGDVAGVAGDAVHVGAGGAAVHRGDVAAAELVDETTEGLEQRLAAGQLRRADDHRLAAAEGQAGQRGLVAHAAGQAHGVARRALLVGIGQIATAAEGRTEVGVVNGDDRAQPRLRVAGQMQLLDARGFHGGEHETNS
ncbi:hypothetical protein D3C75_764760 [compost metagenome]